jgi:alpha-amylase/alpha-mannosidase (GH57 family)
VGHPTLAVHGHFYQPPRENPWTEEVAREPSAAPFHDWNARINAESYRPNGYARIVDDAGRVEAIVNNYAHLSFNIGPTLMAWVDKHAPDTYERILEADARGRGAIAQAYGHLILPLASPRDQRTQVRWGLADFEHRFGRQAAGMWLPEAAVNDDVLAVLVEEGVRFTILAPSQADTDEPVDTSRLYRWSHPDGSGRGIDIVFYDGGLSHAAAFELSGLSSQAFVDRVVASGHGFDGPGLVTLATDGETFGHHHRWGDRLLAHALTVEAPARGIEVANLAEWVERSGPGEEIRIRESAWSCAHGVGRWADDCGCSTGGQPGWNQRWRRPLRAALDQLRDTLFDVFERRGPSVLRDPWAARDAYLPVFMGWRDQDDFAAEHVIGDRVEAFTLLEAQRHAMAMYTSCGWFFNDLAGLETVQVLRYAARVMDLLAELGEDAGEHAFLGTLATAESNDPAEGDGRRIWRKHVVPARVDAERVVAHLALRELLENRPAPERVAAYVVTVVDHDHADRGALALCTGHVRLTHGRTGRATEHVYAALHLGGLEVVGATRPVDVRRDADALAILRQAFAKGAPVTTLLRLVGDGFGPKEFGLDSALPDAAEQIVESAARSLADRFAAAYSRLFEDHEHTLVALARSGYQLPAELRAPGELALARRLEAEVGAQAGSLDPADYAVAVAVARQARDSGLVIDTPAARAMVARLLDQAVALAVAAPGAGRSDGADAALAVLEVSGELGLTLDVSRAQELVYDALVADPGAGPDANPGAGPGGGPGAGADESLHRLAAALHLAPFPV